MAMRGHRGSALSSDLSPTTKRRAIVWKIERTLGRGCRTADHLPRQAGDLLASAFQGPRPARELDLQQVALRARVARQVDGGDDCLPVRSMLPALSRTLPATPTRCVQRLGSAVAFAGAVGDGRSKSRTYRPPPSFVSKVLPSTQGEGLRTTPLLNPSKVATCARSADHRLRRPSMTKRSVPQRPLHPVPPHVVPEARLRHDGEGNPRTACLWLHQPNSRAQPNR